MLHNSLGNQVQSLIRSASRRRHGFLLLEELCHALILVLGGAIFLLLLGTEILDWYWLALLAFIGLGLGIFRFRKRFLPSYQIAQILDRRLQLSDTLSTAWFILTATSPLSSHRQIPVKRADALAAEVHPKAAFPFEGQRAWMISALLFLFAGALFGLRYYVQDKLTFQQPLITIHLSSTIEQVEAKLSFKRRTQEARLIQATTQPEFANGPALPTNQSNKNSNIPAQHEPGELNQDGTPHTQTGRVSGQRTTRSNETRRNEPTKSGNEPLNPTNSPSQKEAQQQSPANNPGNPTGKGQKTQGSQQDQSLASKLREALSGLLAKMQGGDQQQLSRNGQQPPNPNRGKNGAPSGSNEQQSSENNSSRQANTNALSTQQQTQSAEMASSTQRDGSGDSSGHRSSDTRSAAGRQNGSKEAREAEQLKAMGKLAEIIGKRSATVSGEITVETKSGNQQLQTKYTNKFARHADVGSEMDHDTVPLEDQQYVREYMKQVHNQLPAR